jgi:hypothetical protein
MLVGALLILILWFRPDGILGEPKRKYDRLLLKPPALQRAPEDLVTRQAK